MSGVYVVGPSAFHLLEKEASTILSVYCPFESNVESSRFRVLENTITGNIFIEYRGNLHPQKAHLLGRGSRMEKVVKVDWKKEVDFQFYELVDEHTELEIK